MAQENIRECLWPIRLLRLRSGHMAPVHCYSDLPRHCCIISELVGDTDTAACPLLPRDRHLGWHHWHLGWQQRCGLFRFGFESHRALGETVAASGSEPPLLKPPLVGYAIVFWGLRNLFWIPPYAGILGYRLSLPGWSRNRNHPKAQPNVVRRSQSAQLLEARICVVENESIASLWGCIRKPVGFLAPHVVGYRTYRTRGCSLRATLGNRFKKVFDYCFC